jgi:D-glycero-D-manno-heptose 1,7-bisphosphate phosphatase
MQWMAEQFAEQGIALTAVYHCPYHPVHGVGEYRRESEDRKPSPGMLLRAALDHHLDLAQSVLVGDRCSDIAAANAAGLRQAFLLAGTEPSPCSESQTEIATLTDAERWLEAQETKEER